MLGRNELWLSPTLKEKIASQKVFIVGCGGLGVLISLYLAQLGFKRIVICDNDKLEESNLNRYMIATHNDIGKEKTAIISSHLQNLFPKIEVKSINKMFPYNNSDKDLESSAFVLGCLDNSHIRIELDILSRKYKRTYIDMGTGFIINNITGEVSSSGGQVIISKKNNPCVMCQGFSSAYERNGYYLQPGNIEPSSILLNSIIASIGIEVLLNEIRNIPDETTCIEFDRESLALKKKIYKTHDDCNICGINSAEDIEMVANFPFLG